MSDVVTLGVLERVAVASGVMEPVAERVGVPLEAADGDALVVSVIVAEADGVRDPDGVAEAAGVVDGVGVTKKP